MKYKYKRPYLPTIEEYGKGSFQKYLLEIREMKNWCVQHKIDHWEYKKGFFIFDREEDYMMFLLRWQ